MLRLASVLLIVAFCCALVLAVIHHVTAPIIEKQKQMLLERSLRAVLKADKYEKYENGITYYEAFNKQGALMGWCLAFEADGYAGPIRLLAGLGIDEKITGVKVLEHNETPGLGSQINEVKYGQTEAAFLKQFNGKAIERLILIKGATDSNIQAITGATISSRAVTETVKKSVEEFLKIKGK